MNRNSQIILNKMVDHFGKWEEDTHNKKVVFPKHKERTQEKARRVYSFQRQCFETDSMKKRREELLYFIEGMRKLEREDRSQINFLKDYQIKARQEEILAAKKVIEEEMKHGVYRFTLAS